VDGVDGVDTVDRSGRSDRNGCRAQGRPLRLLSPLGPLRPLQTGRPDAHTPISLLAIGYPNILYLRGMPKEFFALALFGGKPVARFTVGDPGGLDVTS
jgi:hypothetical protein